MSSIDAHRLGWLKTATSSHSSQRSAPSKAERSRPRLRWLSRSASCGPRSRTKQVLGRRPPSSEAHMKRVYGFSDCGLCYGKGSIENLATGNLESCWVCVERATRIVEPDEEIPTTAAPCPRMS